MNGIILVRANLAGAKLVDVMFMERTYSQALACEREVYAIGSKNFIFLFALGMATLPNAIVQVQWLFNPKF
ncbi:hypothetical protein [Tolypothrix bouteillei]|uniref:Uncharacterized protein n=1 Tax=Tolypothrix bouteillei VB521301 TaxID=1479485 RepID=A0A8S9TCK4_9CYAN|nr:hypothetical protein DA73_0400033435 [Tolypothrix bouteillei VB521301]